MMLLLLAAGSAHASRLVLKLNQVANYIIKVDGVVYHTNGSFFELNQLQAGHHHIKIIERRRGGHHGQYQRQTVLYNGSLRIPPRSKVVARLNGFDCLDIIRVIRHQPPRYNHQHNHCHNKCGVNERGYDKGHQHRRPNHNGRGNRRG